MPAVAEQSVVCPVCCSGTYGNHGNIVYQEHDDCEDRQTQPTVGDDLIDLVRSGHAGSLFLQAVLDDRSNVQIPFVGDDAFCIVVHFLFCGFDVLFNVLFGSFRNVQLFQNLVVPFEDLDRIPSLLCFRTVMQTSFFNMCDGMLHAAAELVLGNHGDLAFRSLHGFLCSFVNAGALQCGNFHDLTAQFLCQLVNADLVAVLPNDVHHVDRDNYRNAQFYQLCGQIQVAFQIGAVDDVQDCIRTLLNQIISGNDFFQCVRGKRIDTRQVCDDNIFVPFQLTLFLFHGNTRPVTDELVRTC